MELIAITAQIIIYLAPHTTLANKRNITSGQSAKMTAWQITSWLYRHFRKLPPFNTILQAENTNLQQLLSELPLIPDLVVDLGSGHGNAGRVFFQNTPAFPRLFIAIDHEWAMLKQLSQLSSHSPCLASAGNLPLKNESIRLVLAIGLTEYVPDKFKLLAEINRIMRPDSYLRWEISVRAL